MSNVGCSIKQKHMATFDSVNTENKRHKPDLITKGLSNCKIATRPLAGRTQQGTIGTANLTDGQTASQTRKLAHLQPVMLLEPDTSPGARRTHPLPYDTSTPRKSGTLAKQTNLVQLTLTLSGPDPNIESLGDIEFDNELLNLEYDTNDYTALRNHPVSNTTSTHNKEQTKECPHSLTGISPVSRPLTTTSRPVKNTNTYKTQSNNRSVTMPENDNQALGSDVHHKSTHCWPSQSSNNSTVWDMSIDSVQLSPEQSSPEPLLTESDIAEIIRKSFADASNS